jgi:SNF2 family DNA or RNA helicase
VLLFSQYTETLDVLEEYMTFRFGSKGAVFLRLDGQVNRVIREMDIRKFNAEGSKVFVYLISTRAGGQGINLATANSVILYGKFSFRSCQGAIAVVYICLTCSCCCCVFSLC